MTKTTIEWTDWSWNPVTGCDKVSPGCDHCYADSIATRFAGSKAFPNGFKLTLHPERLGDPLGWRKPRRVFVNSMSDLFHPDIPTSFIEQVFEVMERAERHTFQVLTKRPQRMPAILDERIATPEEVDAGYELGIIPGVFYDRRPPGNIWLGTSIENNRYTFRANHLRATPAAVRFLSLEPLLGPLPHLNLTGIDWVIVGGESGRGARPMDPDWARDIRDRCIDRGIPFFFKQWGAHGPTPEAVAGALLDGERWHQFPEEVPA